MIAFYIVGFVLGSVVIAAAVDFAFNLVRTRRAGRQWRGIF